MFVPEGGVEWDMQVSIAGEVGIISNDMDDRRRVVQLGPWQWATRHQQVSPLLRSFVRLEVRWRVG